MKGLQKLFGINKEPLISWQMLEDLEFMKWYSIDMNHIDKSSDNRFLKISTTMKSQFILQMELAPGFAIPKHYHDYKQVYNIITGSAEINGFVIKAGQHFTVFKNVKHHVVAGPEGAQIISELVKIN